MQRSTGLLVLFVLVMLAATLVVKLRSTHSEVQNPVVQQTGYRINLNAADANALALLPGIGPNLAERIVEHRKAHGEFKSVDELQGISGIGVKTVQRIEPFVTCGAAK